MPLERTAQQEITLDLDGLLTRIGAGDEEAFRSFYDATSGRIYAICLRVLRDGSEAQEALQDSFVRIWSTAHRFDGNRGSALAFSVVIARRSAIDRLRRTARHRKARRLDDLPGEIEQLRVSPDTLDIRRCLSLLSNQQREAILLAFIYGLTHGELAHAMDRPIGTVKSWVRRGLGSMRRCLEE